jgi:hypothetical protein
MVSKDTCVKEKQLHFFTNLSISKVVKFCCRKKVLSARTKKIAIGCREKIRTFLESAGQDEKDPFFKIWFLIMCTGTCTSFCNTMLSLATPATAASLE